MRGLLTLVGKEWRDVRAVTAASAVLVVVACLGVRWVLEERYGLSMADFPSTPRHLDVFVPACAALHAMLVAADSVGGEVASRRIDLVELMPAGRGRVWMAKALFLLAASGGFTLWCALVQWGVLASIDGPQFADPFVARALGSPWVLGVASTFAGATLLVSTIGLRGLAAALVGGAVAAGLLGVMHAFLGFLGHPTLLHTPERYEPSYRESIAATWLPSVLFVASALAYVLGRVHLGRIVRPTAIAVAALVAALGAPGAVSAYDALSVVPGRPGTRFRRPHPSPDGRYVALAFVNESAPSQPSKVFVLDTSREVLIEPEVSRGFLESRPGTWDGAWDEDGRLVVHTPSDGGFERVRIDPATGAVVGRDFRDGRAFAAESTQYWESWRRRHGWRLLTNRRCDDGGPTYEATVTDTLNSARPKFRTWAQASVTSPGGLLVYFPEPHVLAVRPLPDGPERRLLEARHAWTGGGREVGDVSPDGRFLLVEHDGTWKALDLETGSTSALPACEGKPGWWRVFGDDGRRLVFVKVRGEPTSRVVDLGTGATLEFDRDLVGDAWASADGHLLVMRPPQFLDLVDRDLKFVRRLWPLGKE